MVMEKSLVKKILKNAKIILDIDAKEKFQIINKLVQSLKISKDNEEMLINAVIQREKIGSTGIGNGIAIPHTRSMVVKDLMVAIGRPVKPIDFGALDKKPVNLVFLLVAPPYASKREYLILLGKIAETFNEISADEKLFSIKEEEAFKAELGKLFGV
jgi:PTS system nitrogen regulatory IIA component